MNLKIFLVVLIIVVGCNTLKNSNCNMHDDAIPTCGKFLSYADITVESKINMIKAEIIDRIRQNSYWEEYENSSLFSITEILALSDSAYNSIFGDMDSISAKLIDIEPTQCYGTMISNDTTHWIRSNCSYVEQISAINSTEFKMDLTEFYFVKNGRYIFYKLILRSKPYQILLAIGTEYCDVYKIHIDNTKIPKSRKWEYISTKYIKKI